MTLNIKHPEAHRLARELAQRKGETLTTAVVVALKERLERDERPPEREARMERLIGIVKRTAPRMKNMRSTKELFDELYDESGLPK